MTKIQKILSTIFSKNTATDEYLACERQQYKGKKALWAFVVLAFIIRLTIAVPGLLETDQRFFRPDTWTYLMPAESLAVTGAYNNSIDDKQAASLRPPGLPTFIASVLKLKIILGAEAKSGLAVNSSAFISFLLIIISALTVIPLFKGALLIGGKRAAYMASIFLIFHITHVAHAPLILSDTLYTFLAAWQCYYFIAFYVKPKSSYALIGMFFLVLATLVRPTGLFWIVPALFLIFLHKALPIKKRFVTSFLSLVIFIGGLFPWLYRNHNIGVGYRLDSNIGNFYYHNAVALEGALTGESNESIRQRWYKQTELEFASNPDVYKTEKDRIEYKLKKMKEVIAKAPFTYSLMHLQPMLLAPDAPTFFENLRLTQTGGGTLDVLHHQGIWAAVNHYFDGKLYLLMAIIPLLGLIGVLYLGVAFQLIWWISKHKWYQCWMFMALVVYYLLLPGPIVMPRYHMPSLPFMCIMAALFFERFYWSRRVVLGYNAIESSNHGVQLDYDNKNYFNYFQFGLKRYIDTLLLRIRSEVYQRFQKEFSPTDKDLILDVGVSPNDHPSSNYFEKLYPYTSNITAVGVHDLSELEQQFPGLTFVEADGRSLPFANDSFDYSYSHAVIEHVGCREKQGVFISELLRVSRKGVIFTTPNRNHPVETHTGLPFIHYLPMKIHHLLYKVLGKNMYASQDNLNLLRSSDLKRLIDPYRKQGLKVTYYYTKWLMLPSNIIVCLKKGDE